MTAVLIAVFDYKYSPRGAFAPTPPLGDEAPQTCWVSGSWSLRYPLPTFATQHCASQARSPKRRVPRPAGRAISCRLRALHSLSRAASRESRENDSNFRAFSPERRVADWRLRVLSRMLRVPGSADRVASGQRVVTTASQPSWQRIERMGDRSIPQIPIRSIRFRIRCQFPSVDTSAKRLPQSPCARS